jgi:hypothetical protein
VVEFVIIDASALPDVEAMRAMLNTSGKSAAAWLTSELAESGRYTTASEARVAGALQATGLTARDCTHVTCMVQLGRMLDVERVVTGGVSKISNLIWYLSATMVDVRSGRVRFHEEFELKGNIADLLPRGIRALARRLVASDSALSPAPQGGGGGGGDAREAWWRPSPGRARRRQRTSPAATSPGSI